MRLYNSGYHAGHHDTVETGYVDIFSCDMENYHEETAREIVQDFLGSNLTDADLRDMQTIFDDDPLPLENASDHRCSPEASETTKELLEDIKKRGLELSKLCEHYRDMNEKGTYEYGFREGQATTYHNQVTWAEDMLETLFPENDQGEAPPHEQRERKK